MLPKEMPMRRILLVVMSVVLALAVASCAETPAAQTSKLAAERAEKLKKNINGFWLSLHYYGENNKRLPPAYYTLDLSLTAWLDPPVPSGVLKVQITKDQARQIIDCLALEGFLDRVKLPEPTTKTALPPQGPVYVLYLSGLYEDNLGWGLPMLNDLDGLRAVLEGDAAKNMDVLLGRMAGDRGKWQNQPATQPAAQSVPFDIHDGYFVLNKFKPDEPASFVVLKEKDDFDQVFCEAAMDALATARRPHCLPPNAFDSKIVAAVVKRGKATWDFTVEGVVVAEGVLIVRYTTKETKSDSTEFACPLIVSVPQGHYAAVEFVEDGKSVRTIKRTWSEMKQDAADEADQADAEMQDVYKQLMAVLDDRERQLLVDAQKAWLNFRDEETEFETDYTGSGSDRHVRFPYYFRRLTEHRTADLREVLEDRKPSGGEVNPK